MFVSTGMPDAGMPDTGMPDGEGGEGGEGGEAPDAARPSAGYRGRAVVER
jgi:hypothetical protein